MFNRKRIAYASGKLLLILFAVITILACPVRNVSAAVPRAEIKKISRAYASLSVNAVPSDQVLYQAALRIAGNKKWTVKKPVKNPVIELKKLKPGKNYEIRVRYVRKDGQKTRRGRWSKVKTARTFRVNAAKFAGRWTCQYELSDPDFSLQWLELEIEKNGHFHSVDVGAGNPGIKGTYTQLSDKSVRINCKNDEDFDPYWKKMPRVAKIKVKVVSGRELRFTYKNGRKKSTLVFRKQ